MNKAGCIARDAIAYIAPDISSGTELALHRILEAGYQPGIRQARYMLMDLRKGPVYEAHRVCVDLVLDNLDYSTD